MPTSTANEDIRTSFWPRVREFAVPASMIETATARRLAGDWAGAGAAAGFDVDPDLRAVARDHGRSVASLVRADLRALAPDLLRRHLPRIAPDGLLRPGVTLTWRGTRPSRARSNWWPGPHPPGRPADQPRAVVTGRRRRRTASASAGESRVRSGAGEAHVPSVPAHQPPMSSTELAVPPSCAVDRWSAEARILLAAEGRSGGRALVRWGVRHRLVLELAADDGLIRPCRHPRPIRAERAGA
ncbi:hypothetical protein [Streptomyces sp. NPDC005760]|uniref:hypothetical protein n=1 Tax=Streptomyces sp. NPDC005760 TaxID=3156718 RepID=UPI0033F408C4